MTTSRRLLHTPWRRALRIWDQASIYLPVVLMGALALGTYWLVRNSPVFNTQEAAQTAMLDVDYYMRKFTVKSFGESGRLKSQIYGAEGRHYTESDTLEIDEARILSISDAGRPVKSSARRALSNGDGSEVQLFGNARVVREAVAGFDGKVLPRLEFQGEFLHAFVNEERVSSHLPVVLIRGADQFSGDSFSYNSLAGIAELKGRVRGRLMPGAVSQ